VVLVVVSVVGTVVFLVMLVIVFVAVDMLVVSMVLMASVLAADMFTLVYEFEVGYIGGFMLLHEWPEYCLTASPLFMA
jgi:hypothetical protein